MPNGPIKIVGEHQVIVAPSGDVVANVKVIVVAELN
jgi:ribosomal protein L9